MAIKPPHIPGLTDWRPLARGGFAVVWEARQETLDRLVAVKIDQRKLDDEAERQRFRREAGAAGRMSAHRGIITVHDANILPDGRPYLVMDLCTGGSLTRYLKPEERLRAQRVREIGLQIADALAATHARGVLHRDVKPANILVDRYDNVGLADFGLAAIAGPETPPEEAFEALTPAYTAPEILRRQPPVATGDVYSLAATMYALLGGRPPRWPEEGTPTLAEVLELQQLPVEPLPEVDPGLMQLLIDALAENPEARPDAAEFGRRLAALPLDGRPAGTGVEDQPAAVGSADGSRQGPDGDRERSGTRRALLGVLAALAVVIVLIAVVLRAVDTPDAAAPAPVSPGTSAPGSVEPSPSSPSPSPTLALPANFADCSAALGEKAFCPTEPECWVGVRGAFDSPNQGTVAACDRTHVQQTFVAGPLTTEVRQQSQLEAATQVKRLCTREVLRRSLTTGGDRSTTWQVEVLPPQAGDGDVRMFRCLFSDGERDTPVKLQLPG
ncbi:serine/threonine-protein kinase [uncultured Friedmanniella sp.]|uniref:serine/threonine-protein kinase n=1 Tax=uncultured Friedmanniella sp. TaxID=335381 RepID=UPI0035CB723E